LKRIRHIVFLNIIHPVDGSLNVLKYFNGIASLLWRRDINSRHPSTQQVYNDIIFFFFFVIFSCNRLHVSQLNWTDIGVGRSSSLKISDESAPKRTAHGNATVSISTVKPCAINSVARGIFYRIDIWRGQAREDFLGAIIGDLIVHVWLNSKRQPMERRWIRGAFMVIILFGVLRYAKPLRVAIYINDGENERYKSRSLRNIRNGNHRALSERQRLKYK
jgi:hypothetical protein